MHTYIPVGANQLEVNVQITEQFFLTTLQQWVNYLLIIFIPLYKYSTKYQIVHNILNWS